MECHLLYKLFFLLGVLDNARSKGLGGRAQGFCEVSRTTQETIEDARRSNSTRELSIPKPQVLLKEHAPRVLVVDRLVSGIVVS